MFRLDDSKGESHSHEMFADPRLTGKPQHARQSHYLTNKRVSY